MKIFLKLKKNLQRCLKNISEIQNVNVKIVFIAWSKINDLNAQLSNHYWKFKNPNWNPDSCSQRETIQGNFSLKFSVWVWFYQIDKRGVRVWHSLYGFRVWTSDSMEMFFHLNAEVIGLDFHSVILSDVADPNFGFSKLSIRVRCTRR